MVAHRKQVTRLGTIVDELQIGFGFLMSSENGTYLCNKNGISNQIVQITIAMGTGR